MPKSSFNPTEEFAYIVLAETGCTGLRLACGCPRLTCVCRLVNPVPFPSGGMCLYWVC